MSKTLDYLYLEYSTLSLPQELEIDVDLRYMTT